MSTPTDRDTLTPKMAAVLAEERELETLRTRFPKLVGGALAYALGRMTDEELDLLRNVLMTTSNSGIRQRAGGAP